MGESLLNKINMFPVPIINGGTGGNTIATAQTNLGIPATEYGTWTPTIAEASGTQPTVTYINGIRYGYYYVIGNLVWITCKITFTTSAVGSANATITGLPYASKSMYSKNGIPLLLESNATTTSLPIGVVESGSTYISLFDNIGSNYNTWKVSASSWQYIGFSGCYVKS